MNVDKAREYLEAQIKAKGWVANLTVEPHEKGALARVRFPETDLHLGAILFSDACPPAMVADIEYGLAQRAPDRS